MRRFLAVLLAVSCQVVDKVEQDYFGLWPGARYTFWVVDGQFPGESFIVSSEEAQGVEEYDFVISWNGREDTLLETQDGFSLLWHGSWVPYIPYPFVDGYAWADTALCQGGLTTTEGRVVFRSDTYFLSVRLTYRDDSVRESVKKEIRFTPNGPVWASLGPDTLEVNGEPWVVDRVVIQR